MIKFWLLQVITGQWHHHREIFITDINCYKDFIFFLCYGASVVWTQYWTVSCQRGCVFS